MLTTVKDWCVGNSPSGGVAHGIHTLVAAVMAVAAAVVPQLHPHISAVITRRETEASWLLPGDTTDAPQLTQASPPSHLLFSRQEIITLLQPTKSVRHNLLIDVQFTQQNLSIKLMQQSV